MNWKSRLIIIISGSLVSACQTTGFVPGGPATSWGKTGTTRAQRHLDYEECGLEAAEKIQPAMDVAVDPGLSLPGSIMCNSIDGITTCNNVGGLNIPPSAISYDANRSTRELYVKVCMEKKRYTMIETKWCQDPHDSTSEDCVIPTP